MNKKAKKINYGSAKAGRLSFKLDTIRCLTDAESNLVLGGRICLNSACHTSAGDQTRGCNAG